MGIGFTFTIYNRAYSWIQVSARSVRQAERDFDELLASRINEFIEQIRIRTDDSRRPRDAPNASQQTREDTSF